MNSRGQSETGKVLWELMALVIVIIVVAAFLVLFLRFIFAGGDNERLATISGFQSLASTVSGVANNAAPFSSNANDPLNLYIGNDYALVAFSKGTMKPVDGCGIGPVETISRPPACGESACLCVYPVNGEKNFDAAGTSAASPLACSAFGNVDFITSFWYHSGGSNAFDRSADLQSSVQFIKNLAGQCDDTLPNAYYAFPPDLSILGNCRTPNNRDIGRLSYASFIAYGRCPTWGQPWGSQQIYVDRIKVDGKSVVLISSVPGKDAIKAREAIALKNSILPLFDTAEKLFKEAKYAEAREAYQKFIDAAKDSSFLQQQVRTSWFRISESHYRVNAFKDAATTTLEFMRKYGVRTYFLDAGLPSFTPLPTPLLTTNNAAPLSTLATDAEIAIAKERFTKLQAALPDSAVFAYLLGHIERRAGNTDRAMALLEKASDTTESSDSVHPFSVLYELGNVYLVKIQESGFDPEIARGLLNVDADIVGTYDETLPLLDLYNNAHSRLVWKCNEWKTTFGTDELCSKYQLTTLASNWQGDVYNGKACAFPEQMTRCGDLTVQNIQDILGTGGGSIGYARPGLHYTESYKCLQGTWTQAFACQEGQYCQNIWNGVLSTGCITPKIPAGEVQP